MERLTREITKEQYDRAMANSGYITEADKLEVFSVSELYGYGVYSPMVRNDNGKFMVSFLRGESCD